MERLLVVILIGVIVAGYFFWPQPVEPGAITPEVIERTIQVVQETGELWARLGALAERILDSPLFALLIQTMLPERMQGEVASLTPEGRSSLTPTPSLEIGFGLDCRRINLRANGQPDYQMDGPLGRASQRELDVWQTMDPVERMRFAESCER
jgi:hypothetical protein